MPLNQYSIVDYLTSKGQPSDFESRKRKYEATYGGEYRGTAEQNTQFLKGLQTPVPTLQPQISTVSPTALNVNQLIAQTKAMLAQTAAEGSKPFFGSSYDVIPKPPITATQIQQQAQNAAAVPQQFAKVIPPQKQMTAEETLAAVRQQPGVQLAEKAAGLDKEAIARSIAEAKGTTAQKAAASGVVFSPAFYDQPLAALDAEKVARDLNVDISVAKIITSAMQEERNAQLKQATASEKAIADYYKTQGMQINPMTGKLEDIPQAETLRSVAGVGLVKMKAGGGYEVIIPVSPTASVSERQDSMVMAAVQKATPVLETSVGTDGYVDPGVYMKLRTDFAASIGSTADFDDTFSSRLSPQERARLGVGKSVGLKAVETSANVKENLDATKAIFQQYKDAGYARKEVESQWKADNKVTTIPEPVVKILDDMFGKSKFLGIF